MSASEEIVQCERGSVAKAIFKVLFGSALSRAASFLTAIVIASQAGPAGFGQFAIFFTVMMLLSQVPGVVDTTYVRHVAARWGKASQDFLRISLVLKGAFFLAVTIFSMPAANIISTRILDKPDSEIYILLGLLAGAFLSLLSSIASVYQAREQFGRFALLSSIFSPVMFLCVMGLLVAGSDVDSLKGALICSGVAILFGIFAAAWLWRKSSPLFPVKMEPLRETVGYGKWLLGAYILYVVFQRVDILVLAGHVSYSHLGVYSAASKIISFPLMLVTASASVLLPRASRALDSRQNFLNYVRSSACMAGLFILIIGLFMLIAPLLLKLLFGEEYSEGSGVTTILLLGAVAVAVFAPLSFVLYGLRNSFPFFLLNAIETLTTIVLLPLMIRVWGMHGAAWAMCLGQFATLTYVLWGVAKGILSNRPFGYFVRW